MWGWEVGVRTCLAQHFFAHSPDKDLSVLLASHSGRRPHDSLVPISRVTPQLQQQEKLQSLDLFVYFCLALQINSLVSVAQVALRVFPAVIYFSICDIYAIFFNAIYSLPFISK